MTWIHKAREDRKAKLIVVDPRVTRSAAKADLYVPIRSGTDLAFYGGLFKYILDNKLYHQEYVVHFTNAANLINADYKGPEELDGLFSALPTAVVALASTIVPRGYQVDARGQGAAG